VIAWVVGVVLAAAAALVALELGCRWWIRRHTRYHVWPPGMRLELLQDPSVFPQVEPRVRFEINADGERGRDVRGDDVGLFRLLLAGGSPVECLALDHATSWPGVLERLLSSPESLRILGLPRVHVGSIGRGGLAAQHLDLIFERVLPQYHHLSAVVVMVGGNDVFGWLEAGAPSSLRSSPLTVRETFGCHPEQPFGWKLRALAMIELARRLRRSWLRPLEVRDQAGAWVAPARRMRAEAKELRTSVPDPAPMLDRFEHHLRQLLQRAQGHADRVLVARQPWFEKKEYTAHEAAQLWHGGMGKPWKQTISVYYSLEVVNQLMRLLDARAVKVADELGIEHLDLRPVLTPSLVNYYDHVHYTPAGAAVVARAVGAALLRRPARAGRSPRSVVAESSKVTTAT
jgi:lysophospholipase L1-like esterase